MNYTDYVASNDYTDVKGYELVIRVFRDNFSFGWYRDIDSKAVVSDSQFDIGTIDADEAEEVIGTKFSCYYVGLAS